MNERWPDLNYQSWKPTYETLHRWLQIVGKLRVCKSPWLNHSWNSTFLVTSRGLTTTAIPLDNRILTIDFDFINHDLIFRDSTGRDFVMPLQNETVASFFERFLDALRLFEVTPTFFQGPNEVMDATPFSEDTTHCTYHPLHAHNVFQVLVRVSNVLQDFRADFIGKSSPVHFFWGSFDLAVTRFSGKAAPAHPGGVPHLPDRVVREAYSHELMSCGFWPGNDMYPQPALYAYAYPEPEGFADISVPSEAFYHRDLHEFILDYDLVRASDDPAGLIKRFVQSVYLGTADLGGWNRNALESSKYLDEVRDIQSKTEGLH
ncbi:MAG: DUF5996 family protein [Bdellovibrionota bacterium]